MSMSNSQKITSLENLQSEISDVVNEVALAVAFFRKVSLKGCRNNFHYDSFERSVMTAESGYTKYYGVDYPIRYELGTPLISALYLAADWEGFDERLIISFPESYLDNPDWIHAEMPYVQKLADEKAENDRLAHERVLEGKRAQLERLKKELGE